MEKKSGKGNRVVKDLPLRKGQDVKGMTISLPYGSIEWTYTRQASGG